MIGRWSLQYTGEINMGFSKKLEVMIDTGSDWLVIEGAGCTDCEGDTYDITGALETGQAEQLSKNSEERSYGAALVVGREYTDTVCVGMDNCVENFKFFYVERQENLWEPVDGILGLARGKPFLLEPDKKDYKGSLILEAMLEQNKITENKVSFYFSPPGEVSFVDFGAPNLENVKNEKEIVYINMLDEFFWSQFN